MTFGEKLQRLRKARGWTQEQLAEQASVSRQSLSKWESDGALPDTAHVIMLADLFGVTTDYLLREADTAEHPNAQQAESTPSLSEQNQPVHKKSPPAFLVIGCILLVLGFLVWLGIIIVEVANPPITLFLNGNEYEGIEAFIRIRHIEPLYYGSIACMLIGAVTLAVFHNLQWWFNRHRKSSDAPSSTT